MRLLLILSSLLGVVTVLAAEPEKSVPKPQPSGSASPAPVALSDLETAAPMEKVNLVATVIPPSAQDTAQGKIAELIWETKPSAIESKDELIEVRMYARIKAKYARKDWTLIRGTEKMSPSKTDSTISLMVLIEGKVTDVDLIAIGPLGELEKEKVLVVFEDWEKYQTSKNRTRGGKRWSLTPGLSLTSNSYTQTRIEDYSQIALTAKISGQFVIKPPKWDLGANVFFTALPLTSSRADGVVARFLGVNVRAGYALPFIPDPWKVSVQLGAYYTTMFVTDDTFGYINAMGPQIFPSVRYVFKNGQSAMAYFKYSPILEGLQLLDLRNREFAAGGGWGKPIQSGALSGRMLFVSLDIAQMLLYGSIRQSSSFSMSLGAGIGF